VRPPRKLLYLHAESDRVANVFREWKARKTDFVVFKIPLSKEISMKSTTAMFLALSLAATAGPLYAADSGDKPQGQSSMSTGMTDDAADKNYQDALDKCMKKSGTAKSQCMKSATKEKCKGMTGTAKSTCMKDATGRHPGSSGTPSEMKSREGYGNPESPMPDNSGGASMGGTTDNPAGKSGAPANSNRQ
jgi:hypothetical protein